MIETVFSLTFIWLVGTFFLLIAYDIYAINKNKPTVSWAVFDISRKFPIIPAIMCLIIGILIGHFFFPIPIPVEK